MNVRTTYLLLALGGAAAAACDKPAALADQPGADNAVARITDSVARAREDSINRAQPGYIIDSLLPIEQELRRFRAMIGGTPADSLGHASPSRDALFQRFVRAVERNDTSALRQMGLSAREFADLVYPESRYIRPPYLQAPGFTWDRIQMRSAAGLSRLLARRGGKPLRADRMTCASEPDRHGKSLLWADCEVRLRDTPDGTQYSERLFGSIIERDGRFKFMSYANSY